MIAALILLQASTNSFPAPLDSFDLRALPKPTSAPCAQARGDEIVVCARRPRQAPYQAGVSAEIAPLLPEAEFGLAGKARMNFEGRHVKVGSIDTNRVMVTVKVPF